MTDGHKPNHRCLACGIEYYACDSCDKKISKTWRTACCTEGHYKAYYAMWQYAHEQISKDEARAVLQEQDARSWENAPSKALIEEIMGPVEEPNPVVYTEEEPAPQAKEAPKSFLYNKKKKNR